MGLLIQEVDGVEEPEIGYLILQPFWRQGLAAEAALATRSWAFGTLGLHRLEILAEVPNLASQRVAEKSGATREGVLRSRLNNRGIARDAVMFSLVPGDLT